MNELAIPAKFLVWIVSVIFATGLFGSVGYITCYVAEKAIQSFQNDQMSYGKFSRSLWSN